MKYEWMLCIKIKIGGICVQQLQRSKENLFPALRHFFIRKTRTAFVVQTFYSSIVIVLLYFCIECGVCMCMLCKQVNSRRVLLSNWILCFFVRAMNWVESLCNYFIFQVEILSSVFLRPNIAHIHTHLDSIILLLLSICYCRVYVCLLFLLLLYECLHFIPSDNLP